MRLQKHKCNVCGEQFSVVCFAELQEKFRKHRCHVPNKRVVRTEQLVQSQMEQVAQDMTTNNIEQHNFNRLVQQGIVVNA